MEWSKGLILVNAAALTALLLLSILSGKTQPPSAFKRSRILQGAFLGLLGWQLAQPLMTLIADRYAWNMGIQLTLAYFLLFNVTLFVCTTKKRLTLLFFVVVGSGTLQALYGSMMVLTGIEWGAFSPKEFSEGLATGTFVNRNHLAGYLEISLAFGIGLLITQMKPLNASNFKERLAHFLQLMLSNKVILRIGLCIMVIALVMTRSRMGNTAFFSSLMLCGFLYMLVRKQFTRPLIILFTSLFIIDMAIVSQWFGLDQLAARLNLTFENLAVEQVEYVEQKPLSNEAQATPELSDTDTQSGLTATESLPNTDTTPTLKAQNPDQTTPTQGTSTQPSQEQSPKPSRHYKLVTGDARDSAWRETLPMVDEYWKTGIGYGNYYTHFPQFRTGQALGFFDHAHNDYLEFLIEFGAVGFVCIALLVITALIKALGVLRKTQDDFLAGAAFTVVMAITAIAIHSWTDFNLYIPANAMLMVIVLAVAQCISTYGDDVFARRRKRRRRTI